jgi:hypothetical protein
MSYKGLRSDGNNRSMVPALILIGLGVVGILSGTGLFRFLGGFIWAGVLGVAAYYAFMEGKKRNNTLLRLAAFPLAGLAIASITSASFGGAAFLAALGLAFALVWHDDKRRWWAMIPAGTFASLAAVTFFEPIVGGSAGWLFLAGLAATFYALTRFEVEPQPWAIYPAIALGVVALLSFTTSGGWVVPLLLIAAGVYLLMRAGVINLPRGGSIGPVGPARREDGDFLTTVPERTGTSAGAPATTVAPAPVAPRPGAAPVAPAPVPPTSATPPATTTTPADPGAAPATHDTIAGEQAAVLAEFDEPTRDAGAPAASGTEEADSDSPPQPWSQRDS